MWSDPGDDYKREEGRMMNTVKEALKKLGLTEALGLFGARGVLSKILSAP